MGGKTLSTRQAFVCPLPWSPQRRHGRGGCSRYRTSVLEATSLTFLAIMKNGHGDLDFTRCRRHVCSDEPHTGHGDRRGVEATRWDGRPALIRRRSFRESQITPCRGTVWGHDRGAPSRPELVQVARSILACRTCRWDIRVCQRGAVAIVRIPPDGQAAGSVNSNDGGGQQEWSRGPAVRDVLGVSRRPPRWARRERALARRRRAATGVRCHRPSGAAIDTSSRLICRTRTRSATSTRPGRETLA
jgi:hypothetical protein